MKGSTKHEAGNRKSMWYALLASCFLFLVSLLICSCGSTDFQGENYGDIMASPKGLELTPHEHKQGWGKSDCSICHNMSFIHLVDRSGTGIDMAVVRGQVATEGLSSCLDCHITNGIDGPTCASCHANGVDEGDGD